MSAMEDKWDKIYSKKTHEEHSPCSVIVENAHLLPSAGKALDLACGMGANAIFLAEHQLQVDAWDVSSIALKKLAEYSLENNLTISTSNRNVEKMPPAAASYDVVTVSHFLHRPTFRALCDSLRMEGLLFYQTYTLEKVTKEGPTNPDYLLAKNELINLCDGMEILVYREEGTQGDVHQGWRNQAMIVAKRTK